MIALDPAFTLIGEASVRGGVLILCVLLLRWLARGKLPSLCLGLLWLLVALKLLVPIAPTVSWSVFNVRHWNAAPLPLLDDSPQWRVSVSAEEAPPLVATSTAPRPVAAKVPPRAVPWPDRVKAALPGLWLAGVIAQCALLAAGAIRFRRMFARSRPLTHPRIAILAGECRQSLGLKRPVAILEAAGIDAPAVTGVFRPRLFLPEGFAARVSEEELRFVLLHEFSHVRRGDLVLLWFFTFARVVHWFNPLVWIAAWCARADAELACDERVLRLAHPAQAADYGTALLKVARLVSWRPSAFPTAGVIGSGRTLKTRVQRIAAYTPPTRAGSLLTVVIVLLAAAGFAGNEEQPAAPTETTTAVTQPAETPAPEIPTAVLQPPTANADDWKLVALSFAQRGSVMIPHARIRRGDGTEFTLFGKGATREGVTLSSVEWSKTGEPRVVIKHSDASIPLALPAAVASRADSSPPPFAEGWKVVGISLPAPADMSKPAITFETPAGVSLTLESESGNESGLRTSVDGLDDTAAPLRVELWHEDGEHRTTLPAERTMIAYRAPDPSFAPQVEIDAKFFEFPLNVPVELGLEGILGTGKPTSSPPFGVPGIAFPFGVLSDAQFQTVLRALGKKKGADLLSAPRVTTKSRQRAVIEIIREFRYPSEWEEDPKKPGWWLPKAFETKNTGVTLEVTPTVGESGQVIDLELRPQVVEFAGFVDLETRQPLGGMLQPSAASRGALSHSGWILVPGATYGKLKPGRRTQPVFSERVNTTSLTIVSGQTVLLTSFPEPRDTKPFRRKGGDRRLVVMVTARLLPPPGVVTGAAPAKTAATGENVGSPVPNKPGFVTSPYSPDKGYIDVRGFPSGIEVKDPYSGKMFRVP